MHLRITHLLLVLALAIVPALGQAAEAAKPAAATTSQTETPRARKVKWSGGGEARLSVLAGMSYDTVNIGGADDIGPMGTVAIEGKIGTFGTKKLVFFPQIIARVDRYDHSYALLDPNGFSSGISFVGELAEIRTNFTGRVMMDLQPLFKEVGEKGLFLEVGAGIRATNWAAGRIGMGLIGPDFTLNFGYRSLEEGKFGKLAGLVIESGFSYAIDCAQVEQVFSVFGDPMWLIDWKLNAIMMITKRAGVGFTYLADATRMDRLDDKRLTHAFGVVSTISWN